MPADAADRSALDVLVMGLGNVLVGDDAFGPWVIRTLDAGWVMPAGVELADLGTPGLDLTPHLAARDCVIVVDTVKMAAPPGTIRCFRKHDLVARGATPRTNPHQPTLADALLLLELEQVAPREVLLIGAAPAGYCTGAPLSPPLRDAGARAGELVRTELRRLGLVAVPREPALSPDIWWEAQPAAAAAAPPLPAMNERWS
jgi:hydrogenase maturation protease